MNKILLIIQREYLTRVKKKSFIVMTLLGPVLMAFILIAPVWFAMHDNEEHRVEVIDESGLFDGIPDSKTLKFDYPPIRLEIATRDLYHTDYSAILYIPPNIANGSSGSAIIYYQKQLGIEAEGYIKKILEKKLYDLKLKANNIDVSVLKSAETTVNIITEKQIQSGQSQRTETGIFMVVGYIGGTLIYMFIFMFGVMVMRGVMEEKTSRIVEVILSSVKPFQLMMGKIIGVGLVGLTQFVLWLVLTFSLYSVLQTTVLKNTNETIAKQEYYKNDVLKKGADMGALEMNKKNTPDEVTELYENLGSVNFTHIIVCFLFYFLGGYLLYSAMFAAVGAAVDSEADTQQFMLPITMPLVLSFVLAQAVIKNPESSMAFWLSIIPFTSPIIMMVRLPFGVPLNEIVLSITLLIAGFLGVTWLAAKIYRTGILLYGKKITYKELWKWLFYKG